MKAGERIKNMIKSFLDIKEPQSVSINIEQLYDLNTVFFVNNLWYRGQANELQDFYEQLDDGMGNNSFWASRPTAAFNFRKTHYALPQLIVEMFVNIMTNDMVRIKTSDEYQSLWEDVAKDNDFNNVLQDSIRGIMVKGDGAFKISYDTNVSKYPIIEWWDGDKVDFEVKRGRIVAVVFKSKHQIGNKIYVLKERYHKDGIENTLWCNDKQVAFPAELKEYKYSLHNDNGFIMAVPVRYGKSKLFEHRGEGVINSRIPQFDKLDETISLWGLANRKGQIKTYLPENMLSTNPNGTYNGLNHFDNDYVVTTAELREGIENKITTTKAEIPANELLAAYYTDLDNCLTGLISPSTLGIDVKKLDNAKSQREKEKTTLYTRGQLMSIYQDAIPKLVNAVLAVYNTFMHKAVDYISVDVSFGEYANPSFEAVIETMSKARGAAGAVMSVEAQVEELWGDSKDEDWKKKEVERLKSEMGIAAADEPSVNSEISEDEININE